MIVINERKWAEQILETGDLGDNIGLAVYVLARYFNQVEGLKKKDNVAKIDALLSQLIPDYLPSRWEQLIDKAVANAKKRKLIEIDQIPVTTGEMTFIYTIESKPVQRLAFTMIVVARYFNILNSVNNNWVNLSPKELCNMAGVHVTVEEQAKMYRTLIDIGFIEYSKKVGNNNARVAILDDTEPEVYITDLRSIGNEFRLYDGEPYSRCERCGILIRQNKNKTRKYCNDCSKRPAMKMRKYTCIDCGKEVFVVSRDNASCRCADCKTKARKAKYLRYNDKRGS